MRLPPEKRSQGPLIATIDLLFLLVCFFLLLIFFSQQKNQEAQKQVQAAQQTLARITGEELPNVSKVLEVLEPVLQTFMVQQRQEAEKQRQLAAREVRRAQRDTARVSYDVLPGNKVVYEGRTYSVDEFRTQVLAPLRKGKWVNLRATADPRTPFGEVVNSRRAVLENSGEFDTYWDNVTPAGQPQDTGAKDRPR
ncbi:MAG TPA: hypothetical protein VF678_07590 [bacterium]